MEPVLKLKRLRESAVLPLRATKAATGLDLYACLEGQDRIEIGPDVTLVPTGIACESPEGYDIQIRPRSGLARRGVNVIFGTLDSDYRGELFVSMHTFGSTKSYQIENGDRIAQMVVSPVLQADFSLVDSLSLTIRGDGGFGSTGEK